MQLCDIINELCIFKMMRALYVSARLLRTVCLSQRQFSRNLTETELFSNSTTLRAGVFYLLFYAQLFCPLKKLFGDKLN